MITEFELNPRLRVENFDIFDLSSLYFKRIGKISMSIDLSSSSICVSHNMDRYGLCQNNLFNIDLSHYDISSCVKENEDDITVLHLDSKTDDSYVEIIIELRK